MTHQEKIEAIREACVKANPNKCIIVTTKDIDSTIFEPGKVIDVTGIVVPITLSDVMNAIMHTEHTVCIASNERFEVFKDGEWVQVFKTWCFANDNLEDQDESTIDFIYDLIK